MYVCRKEGRKDGGFWRDERKAGGRQKHRNYLEKEEMKERESRVD